MVTFNPALPDTASEGDPGHVTDHNTIVTALTDLNNGKPDTADAVLQSLVDAKGDLLVGTAADTVARLPVGTTTGHVLTVDATRASGMKWAAASGGTGGAATGVIDVVRDYDAAGDDSTDDTTALQNALDAGAGQTVYFPPGTYKISDALTVAAGTTVTGTGTIHQVTSGAAGLVVQGDGVTIEGITLQGRNATADTYTGSENAIDAAAADLAGAFTGLTVRDVTILLWGSYGVRLQWVDGFSITGCNIHDCGYMGIGTQSAANGIIQGNRIDNITPGTSSNMYGIALTFGGTENAANPSTRDVVVDSNIISNVAWEGFDTHGGLRITVSNNTILHCKAGLAFVAGSITGITDCVVSGNVVDYLTDDADADNIYGFQVFGVSSSAPASGVVITGNTFRRHSYCTLNAATGVIIANNVFDRMYQICIWIESNVKKALISGNTIIDNWAPNGSWTMAIRTASDGNNSSATLVGNTIARGALAVGSPAKVINGTGFHFDENATGCSWTVLGNELSGATTQITGNSLPLTPVAGAVTGARDESEGALANLLTVLETAGIITDSSTAS